MSDKLKPCPFIRCKHDKRELFQYPVRGTWAVRCGCGAEGPEMPTRKEAVTAWNERVTEGRK